MDDSVTPLDRRRKARQLGLVACVVAVTVGALVWWGLVRSEATPWGEARVEGDDVVVSYLAGECDRSTTVSVEERDETVEITVRIRGWALSCSDVAIPREARVSLRRPLGERTLIDGACRMRKHARSQHCSDR